MNARKQHRKALIAAMRPPVAMGSASADTAPDVVTQVHICTGSTDLVPPELCVPLSASALMKAGLKVQAGSTDLMYPELAEPDAGKPS
jgi:hypothetical protein